MKESKNGRPVIRFIGAGIYGVTAASFCARAGYDVIIHERRSFIAAETTQFGPAYRIHKGDHFLDQHTNPEEFSRSFQSFFREYGEAAAVGYPHTYGIAREGSKTTPQQCLNFLDRHEIRYERTNSRFLNPDNVALMIKLEESFINPEILPEVMSRKLGYPNINLRLNSHFKKEDLADGIDTFIATYSMMNELLEDDEADDYLFKIQENPIGPVDSSLIGNSVSVFDGDFPSLDPYGLTNKHRLAHVKKAVLAKNVGKMPIIPAHLRAVVNQGPFTPAQLRRLGIESRFEEMRDAAAEYIPLAAKMSHEYSVFSIKSLPSDERDLSRKSTVRRVSDNLGILHGGKYQSAVLAAMEVVRLANERSGLKVDPEELVGTETRSRRWSGVSIPTMTPEAAPPIDERYDTAKIRLDDLDPDRSFERWFK